MTPESALALWGMFVLGALGLVVHFNLDDEARRWKAASLVWTLVWAGPPLIRLWIAGVTA